MFASLVIERDPLTWSELPTAFLTWLQDAGGFAAAGLAVWFLVSLLRRQPAQRGSEGGLTDRLFTLAVAVAALAYVAAGGYKLIAKPDTVASDGRNLGTTLLAVAGGCALAAVLLPFLRDVARMRWRRIWAMAQLSFKEAVRRKVLWVFTAMLLVVLFGTWFLPYRPEDQLRNYVHTIFIAMTLLLLVTAGLISAFSIPADIKNQTIHTIVTKPVERFEIVVGRFLGYTLLMSAVLVVMTLVGLSYLVREIDPGAKEESFKARVPVYGLLRFEGTGDTPGISVGREWEYRRYIAGGANVTHRAVWTFPELPAGIANRTEDMPLEFNFDIFRTHKGEEGKGVFCTFEFRTPYFNREQLPQYLEERKQEILKNPAGRAEIENRLAEKYGYHRSEGKQVFDYHTQTITIPHGLLQHAKSGDPRAGAPLEIVVRLNNAAQYIGMARHDLYLLDAEGWFPANFFKGAVGLWLILCVVIGLAVAMSTYLSGVISFLTTMFLLILGYFQDFIRELVTGTLPGGGPMQSLVKLVNRDAPTRELEESAAKTVALTSDEGFRLLFRVLLDIIPDVDRFYWTEHVAEGFNISGGQMGLALVQLAGYLVPCGLIGYYLMKSREVAA